MEATTPKQSRKLLRTSQAITCAVLVAFAAHTGFGIGGRGLNSFFNDWVYNALVLVAAVSCLLRAVRLRERRAGWLVLGMGLASWSTGEIYNTVHLAHLQNPPYPSLSDLLQLLFYPASCVALLLLARGRVRHARASLWLDGIVAALAVCMVGEVTVFHTVVAAGAPPDKRRRALLPFAGAAIVPPSSPVCDRVRGTAGHTAGARAVSPRIDRVGTWRGS